MTSETAKRRRTAFYAAENEEFDRNRRVFLPEEPNSRVYARAVGAVLETARRGLGGEVFGHLLQWLAEEYPLPSPAPESCWVCGKPGHAALRMETKDGPVCVHHFCLEAGVVRARHEAREAQLERETSGTYKNVPAPPEDTKPPARAHLKGCTLDATHKEGCVVSMRPCPHGNVGCGTTRVCEVCKDGQTSVQKATHHPTCHTVQMAGKDAWPACTCPHSPEPKNEPCPPGTRPMATLCAWCRRNPSVASFSREGTGSPICAECVWPASRGKPVLGNPPAWATQHEPESQADDHVPQPTRAEAAQMMSDLSGVNSVCRGNSTISPRQALVEALAAVGRAQSLMREVDAGEHGPEAYDAISKALKKVQRVYESAK